MDDFEKHLQECLKDEDFKKEWEASETEFQIAKMMCMLRAKQGLTQKELAQKSGINQANISKLERGNSNVTLKTIDKLLRSMGQRLKIEAIPA